MVVHACPLSIESSTMFNSQGMVSSALYCTYYQLTYVRGHVYAEHKFEIVKRLQEKKHICGMTGDGVNDAPALKKADIGIAVAGATDAARSGADIVLTEPGLSVIISAVLTSRSIFQRMKNYTVISHHFSYKQTKSFNVL